MRNVTCSSVACRITSKRSLIVTIVSYEAKAYNQGIASLTDGWSVVAHRVLLGNVGSFATRAQQSTALERCRTGLRLREAVDVGGESDLLFFFPLSGRKLHVDDKEASY